MEYCWGSDKPCIRTVPTLYPPGMRMVTHLQESKFLSGREKESEEPELAPLERAYEGIMLLLERRNSWVAQG